MGISIVKSLLKIVFLVLLLWKQPVTGRPIGCSLASNFIVKYAQGRRCLPCPECPEGQGLSPQCGSKIPNGTKIECKPCRNKTFSNSHGVGSCSPCNNCGLKNIIQPCTPYQNSKCGKECPNGYFLNDNDDCQAEATSAPTGTETTVHRTDSGIHNMTDQDEQLKTTQVYDGTGLSTTKNASDGHGETTATPSLAEVFKKHTTLPTKNSTDDLEEKEKTVNQTTFIVIVAVLICALLMAVILAICCVLRKRSGTESSKYTGEAEENMRLSSPELESDGSTQVEDIVLREEAEPSLEKIPEDFTVFDIESLHADKPMLFYLKSELDPSESLTKKTWRSVGQALNVKTNVLDLIETEYKAGRSPTEALIEILKTSTKEPATLREFVKAIITCERFDVASHICNWPWPEKLDIKESTL